jgi:hypothetical protein
MLYVHVIREAGKVTRAKVANERDESERRTAESRWDWKTFEAAQEVAAALGQGYIATDAGHGVSPRYDVIELPKVGDKVSYAFNGDYYPCGEIASISKTLKCITTTEGRKFYRVRQTGCWKSDGTWSLVSGHISKQNPEF